MPTPPPKIPAEANVSPRLAPAELEDLVARAAQLQERALDEAEAAAEAIDPGDVRRVARELGVDPQYVDAALAERDRRKRRRKTALEAAVLGVLLVSAGLLLRSACHALGERTASDPGSDRVAAPDASIAPAPPPTDPRPAPVTEAAPPVAAPASLETQDVPEELPPQPDTSVHAERAVSVPARPAPPPVAPAAAAERLATRNSSPRAATAMADRIRGTWALRDRLLISDGALVEVPAAPVRPIANPAETWQFDPDGRYRRTLGSDFTVSGRYLVNAEIEDTEMLRDLEIGDWWLVSLNGVSINVLAGQRRGPEWILVGRDGSNLAVLFLGQDAKLADGVMGGRFSPHR